MNQDLLTTTSLALTKADTRIVHVVHRKATIATTTIDGGGRQGDATTIIKGGPMSVAHLKPNVMIREDGHLRGNLVAKSLEADTAIDGRLEANTTTTTMETKTAVLLTLTSDIVKGDGNRKLF